MQGILRVEPALVQIWVGDYAKPNSGGKKFKLTSPLLSNPTFTAILHDGETRDRGVSAKAPEDR